MNRQFVFFNKLSPNLILQNKYKVISKLWFISNFPIERIFDIYFGQSIYIYFTWSKMLIQIGCIFLVVPVAVMAQSPFAPCKWFISLDYLSRDRSECNLNTAYVFTGGNNATHPHPVSVHMANCNTQHCVIRRDTPAPLTINFISQIATTNRMTARLLANTGGNWFLWQLGRSTNVCSNMVNSSCPLASRALGIYRAIIRVPQSVISGTNGTIQLRIIDQNPRARIVVCTRVSILFQWIVTN